MPESTDPILDGVRSWLERGGYVLELESARVLSRLQPLFLEQSYHFADPTTGKDREGDIRAAFIPEVREDGLGHGCTVLVECKDTTAPWVFFVSGPSPGVPWMPVNGTGTSSCPECLALLDRGARIFDASPEAYAVTEKRTKDNSKDHAYEAVQQAAASLLAEFADIDNDGHEMGFGIFGYAIVVTRSPLVVCRLDQDGDIALSQSSSVTVNVPRIDVPDDGAGSGTRAIQVAVLRPEALQDFVAQLIAPISESAVRAAVADLREVSTENPGGQM